MNGEARAQDIRVRGPWAENAASRQDHVPISSGVPALISDGFHVLPRNAEAAVRFFAEAKAQWIQEYWTEKLEMLRPRAQYLTPEPVSIRRKLKKKTTVLEPRYTSRL